MSGVSIRGPLALAWVWVWVLVVVMGDKVTRWCEARSHLDNFNSD